MSVDTREERLARRVADLYATDQQFADARPSEAITAAIDQTGLRLPQIVRTVMEGYAGRPALGQRAVRFVNDRRRAAHPSSCCRGSRRSPTASCGIASARSRAVWQAIRCGRRSGLCAGLHQRRLHDDRHGAGPDRRGFRSAADQRARRTTAAYRCRDRAERDRCERRLSRRRGRTGLDRHTPARLIVFDYRPEVDDQREALDAAKARLAQADSLVIVETLADVSNVGRR